MTVALRFGQLLAGGEYSGAHSLLSKETQKVYSPERLALAVAEMVAYAPGPILEVVLVPEGCAEGWPTKEPGDLASVYLALAGKAFNEAVSAVLMLEDGSVRLRALEWGRP
jgi:hypothetical protein